MTKKTFGPQHWLFPMPAVLVGALVDGKPNYMTAAWCGMVNSSPPTLVVGLQPVRHTRRGLEEHQTFSINVPSADLVVETDFAGIYTGKKTNKSDLFTSFYGVLKTAPMIEECPINLECRVVKMVELESHGVFFGRIMETHASESCLEDGLPAIKKIDTFLWSPTDNHYFSVGQPLAKAFSAGKKSLRK